MSTAAAVTVLTLLAGAILGWGYLTYFFIKEPVRQWYFGGVPTTPGESIYSTSEPAPVAPQAVPVQLPPLPPIPPATGATTAPAGGAP